MASTEPPLPPSGSFVKSVRESSRAARVAANIQIDTEAIKRLLLSPAFTTTFHRVSGNHGLVFPLKFSSPLAELNFLSVLSLLNFGSGYRAALHAQTGRGAWDSIRALVFSIYIGEAELLSAKGMQGLEEGKVAELMGINVHVERPHESIPGVTVGELGGPGYELVKIVTNTMTSAGDALVNAGYPDLGTFVVEALKEGERVGKATGQLVDVDVVLERLVKVIPGFRDMAVVDGRPIARLNHATDIYCFKKALFLVDGVYIRFHKLSPPPFPIPHATDLPICADNVIPSMLVYLGVIDLSSTTTHSLSSIFPRPPISIDSLLDEAHSSSTSDQYSFTEPPKEGPVLTMEQAFLLRAASIEACEVIVQVARGLKVEGEEAAWIKEITLLDVDTWLWAVAKDREDYRKLDRFALKGMDFF
ncbi:hypothetical protein NEOLEDRAFT_1151825 [Neolentinus lepideus HHB14362 ss-1]|uniref:Queuosine 5'-phosphate N-glycosylase/hydrolase n=1 Tax=Neolentinus lepideus HHB14362 ss-1 TaxID=1314782 RepID=A0A165NJ19_9AGAM|nr:hypothetical protein NEOLEDRAFT_1151825 [Neolentinus lepideus HHB14362 ss-1]